MTNERPATAGRSSLVGLRALLIALVAVSAVLVAPACGGESAPAPEAGHPEQCVDLEGDAARECYIQEFLLLVEGGGDSREAVADIASTAREKGGYLLSNCHGIMHTVGRTYAGEEGVTLATLMEYLPPSNDPGCTAGYSHGLATAVAPELHSAEPQEVADVCAEAETRYQRYSCTHGFGHAYMRMHGDRLEPALEFCRSLGSENAPDCAQGAYHDYWFATLGLDDAKVPGRVETDPFILCAEQPDEFVRPCWYRAFLETRPAGFQLETPEDVAGLCEGLRGVQRAGCITAASVIGPTDPAVQLEVCAGLPDAEDATNCVRGTKVQNLLDATTADYVELIEGCERFDGGPRTDCYFWLGKTLAVVTDGAFAEEGCPELQSDAARRECAAGADSMDEALVTFS